MPIVERQGGEALPAAYAALVAGRAEASEGLMILLRR